MTLSFPSPTDFEDAPREVLLGYLAYFRSALVEKLAGLAETELRGNRLPSGWSPLELLQHLTHVERRWLEWGFEGRDVDDPWADHRDGRWSVDHSTTLDDLVEGLASQATRSEAVVRRHELAEVGAPGPRWDDAPPAELGRVLLHLLQEYARHVGHLDVVRELIDGAVGE